VCVCVCVCMQLTVVALEFKDKKNGHGAWQALLAWYERGINVMSREIMKTL
jgi:hypothetical protein